MNRCHRNLLLTLLALAIAFSAGLSWALPKGHAQNPPPQKKVEQQKQDQTDQELTEEEYNAWEAAQNEKDPNKQAALVMAFMEKWPKSKLKSNVVNIYETLMFNLAKAGDYKTLAPLAEQWLKVNPNELKTQAYVFDAAVALGNSQKVIEWGEKLYAISPGVKLAEQVYQAYEKLGNKEKKDEWRLKLLQFPEYTNDIQFRFQLVVEYTEKKELPKAADYAQQTLKALPAAQKPASVSDAEWNQYITDVKKTCYDVIASNYYAQKSYQEAVQNYQQAVDIDDYDSAYFYIGQSQLSAKDVDSAIESFARAEYLNGRMKAQATKYLEESWKSQHDGNLTGIEKPRKRAKDYIDARKKK
jgi:tetratricopeptide (TPR) repeat protein